MNIGTALVKKPETKLPISGREEWGIERKEGEKKFALAEKQSWVSRE